MPTAQLCLQRMLRSPGGSNFTLGISLPVHLSASVAMPGAPGHRSDPFLPNPNEAERAPRVYSPEEKERRAALRAQEAEVRRQENYSAVACLPSVAAPQSYYADMGTPISEACSVQKLVIDAEPENATGSAENPNCQTHDTEEVVARVRRWAGSARKPAVSTPETAAAPEAGNATGHAENPHCQTYDTEQTGAPESQTSSAASETRNATEHSPLEAAAPMHARNTYEQTLALMPPEQLMKCSQCQRALCGLEHLTFFRRVNKQDGVEVHLMLKPEIEEPETFIRAAIADKGAVASWQCLCGFKFGDTRRVGVKKAPMTAFKSSSVILCGRRLPGQKSKWPSVYDQPPFETIEVRNRDPFLGT